MFNFFRKKTKIHNETENVFNDIEKDVLKSFSRSYDELLKDPSFSILIQINQEKEEFVIAVDGNDFSDNNAELIASFLFQLTHGGVTPIILDALESFPENSKEKEFILNTVIMWRALEAADAKVDNEKSNLKNKIDPAKIFNIRGGIQ
jgi:hypothetical protein